MNMKMISMVMMVFGFSGLAARASQDEGGLAKVVTVSPDRAFVPAGFDDNDNVEFVVTGKLPSTCFNIGPSETSVDPRSHRITLEQKAIYSSSCWCKQVIVPYDQVVQVGHLESGRWSLQMKAEGGRLQALGSFLVEKARTAQQYNFVYAPVTEAYMDPNSSSTLIIGGRFQNDCMSIKSVKTFYSSPNIVVVLPIVEFDESSSCQATSKPFQVSVQLRSPGKGQSLIHIRSMSGQAVNRLVEF